VAQSSEQAPTPAAIPSGRARAGDAWADWSGFKYWHLLLYGALAAAALSILVDPSPDWWRRSAFLVLAVALGGWYWLGMLRGRAWTGGRRSALVYYLGFVLGVAGLILIHPAGYWLVFALYWQVYSLWPLRLAIAGSAGISVMLWVLGAWSSDGSLQPSPEGVAIGLLALVVGGLLAAYIDAIIRQSADRRRLIAELEAARDEVAAAERRSGALAERQRLAGEIHDTLAQGFASIVIHLETAEATLERDRATTARHLDQARRTARDSLAEARRLVWALRPELLTKATLPEALARLAERWGEEHGATTGLTVTGTMRPLRPEAEVTLLRAAQEALANAAKHAAPRHATLTLSYLDDAVTLDVQDDGRGFSPDAAARPAASSNGIADGGYGLAAMRARVESLGGSVAIESEPGEGTTIAVVLPAPPDPWPGSAAADRAGVGSGGTC